MVNILNNIVSTFFPAVCVGCNTKLKHQEKCICTHCKHELPFTNFHKTVENPAQQLFYGRVTVKNVTALLFYRKKGITQQLLHHLKYKNRQEIGQLLGNFLGNDLKALPRYQTVTHVIPVPLHKKRLRKRGYNQLTTFGKQLAAHLNADYTDHILIKNTHTEKQAFKNRAERWLTIQDSFAITDTNTLQGKHILLIDDVMTTGATLEACVNTLHHIPNCTISIATMSIAS